MAMGRLADRSYFLGIVHDEIKTGFTRKKEAISYTQMVFIVLLAIKSSKQRKDAQCLERYRLCLLSVYDDIVTCSQQKLKNVFFFFFFISLVAVHVSPYF